MPRTLAQVAAELFPKIASVLPGYFMGLDFASDAICLRDSRGSTTVLFTRQEIDDNIHSIVLDSRLGQIAAHGKIDLDSELELLPKWPFAPFKAQT